MHTAASAKPPKDSTISHYVRWKFDLNSTEPQVEPTELVNLDGEMPKVDARYETKPYSQLFLAMHDPNSHEPAIGGAYNSIARCSIKTGKYEYWSAGKSTALHEVAFVPRSPDGKIPTHMRRDKREATNYALLCVLSPRGRRVLDLGSEPERQAAHRDRHPGHRKDRSRSHRYY